MILRAGLLGKSLRYSVSQELHEMLFPLLRPHATVPFESISYRLIECETECDVAQWMKTAMSNGFIGANVTIPYKSTIYQLCDKHVFPADVLQSGNTVYFGESSILASTDGQGWRSAFERSLGKTDFSEYHLVLVGAGSAAQAVLHEIIEHVIPKSIRIVSREPDRSRELIDALDLGGASYAVSLADIASTLALDHPAIIVQATPLGQKNGTTHAWHPTGITCEDIVCELVYNPIQTALLKQAESVGARSISGLGMLIEQAALSQMYWLTGVIPSHSPLSDEEFQRVYRSLSPMLA